MKDWFIELENTSNRISDMRKELSFSSHKSKGFKKRLCDEMEAILYKEIRDCISGLRNEIDSLRTINNIQEPYFLPFSGGTMFGYCNIVQSDKETDYHKYMCLFKDGGRIYFNSLKDNQIKGLRAVYKDKIELLIQDK